MSQAEPATTLEVIEEITEVEECIIVDNGDC